MKKYLSILFVLTLTLNTFVFAQDEGEETEISTVEALLQLVKEGKTKEPVSYTHLTLPTIYSV